MVSCEEVCVRHIPGIRPVDQVFVVTDLNLVLTVFQDFIQPVSKLLVSGTCERSIAMLRRMFESHTLSYHKV